MDIRVLGFGVYFYSTLLPLLVQAAACLTRWVIYVGTLNFSGFTFVLVKDLSLGC